VRPGNGLATASWQTTHTRRISEKVLKTDLPTYDDVLRMLANKAGEGSVSAMVALERALRHGPPEEANEVPTTIDRILAKSELDCIMSNSDPDPA
jgi:hypothetical protein